VRRGLGYTGFGFQKDAGIMSTTPAHSIAPEEISRHLETLPITFEPIPQPEDQQLEPQDQERIEEHFEAAKQGSQRAIKVLRHLASKYPHVPLPQNHLYVAYTAAGDSVRAKRTLAELCERHPDYLFGRIHRCWNLLKRDDGDRLDEIPELLGERLQLDDYLSDREVFHSSEVTSFYGIVAEFHLAKGRQDLASAIHQGLVDRLDPDEPILRNLEWQLMAVHFQTLMDRKEADEARAIRVREPALRTVDQVSDWVPPGFRHAEIEELYRYGFDLPTSDIEAILALPRESVIPDLEAALRDALDRGPLYRERRIDVDDRETFFPIHALLLLGELEASESLPLVLETLSQPQEALDYWFGEVLSGELWRPLHQLVDGRLERATDFVLTAGVTAVARNTMAEAVARFAVYHPERREEILDWFRHVLEFLLESPPEDNILDTDLVSELVVLACDLQGEELLPLIRRHYDAGYVSVLWVGDLEEVEKSLSEPTPERLAEPLRDLPDLYDELRRRFPSGGSLPESAPFPEPPDVPTEFGGGRGDRIIRGGTPEWERLLGGAAGAPEESPSRDNPAAPQQRRVVKVGRNEPCPCGSGKKYKKCCG